MLSLNEIHESIFELLRTKVKTNGGGSGATDVKPVYPRLLSGDINIMHTEAMDDKNTWCVLVNSAICKLFCRGFSFDTDEYCINGGKEVKIGIHMNQQLLFHTKYSCNT